MLPFDLMKCLLFFLRLYCDWRLIPYLLKWQSTGIVAIPVMNVYLTGHFSYGFSPELAYGYMLSQLIGGIVFFPVDKFIFNFTWENIKNFFTGFSKK